MQPPSFIRASLPEDIHAINEIYAVHVRDGTGSFELTPPSESEMAERRIAIVDAGLPYLIAELEGTVAGYAYAGAYHLRPAYEYTVESSVYVADWAQRRGIGRQLLNSLILACEAVGKRQMIAVIGDSDNAASIKLHETCGFRHVGVLKNVGVKHGRWLDVVMMQRQLDPGADSIPAH